MLEDDNKQCTFQCACAPSYRARAFKFAPCILDYSGPLSLLIPLEVDLDVEAPPVQNSELKTHILDPTRFALCDGISNLNLVGAPIEIKTLDLP